MLSQVLTEQPLDLSLALSEVRCPVQPPSRPSVGLPLRLKTTPVLRRVLPTRIVVERAVRRGATLWNRSEPERERARNAIVAIVAGTEREGEVESLAREHVIEHQAQSALLWQPWETANLGDAAAANLRAAFASGRGVLVSRCHMGPSFQSASVGAALDREIYVVAGAWCFAEPSSDYWGRRVVRTLEGYHEQRTTRLVPAPGSFAVLHRLLEQREIVMIAFDVPGRHQTHFLGKPVMLAAGTAKLAVETDALIVPMCPRRVGHRLWVDAATPLDPRDFSDRQALHQALAAVHERWILECPAALEDPHRPGFWEAGATARSWVTPETHPA
jgi:lauroyl/myristoyl acyltransferase